MIKITIGDRCVLFHWLLKFQGLPVRLEQRFSSEQQASARLGRRRHLAIASADGCCLFNECEATDSGHALVGVLFRRLQRC